MHLTMLIAHPYQVRQWPNLARQSTSLTQGLIPINNTAANGQLVSDHPSLFVSNLMIGNGLMNYDFNAGNGNPSYDLFVDKLDG